MFRIQQEDIRMNKYITAIYENEENASQAINQLEKNQVSRESINVLVSKIKDKHTDIETDGNEVEALKKTAIGGAIGGVTGALLASLTTVTISGGLSLLAIGPIMATLSAAGVGSIAGGVVGALLGLGFSEDEAQDLNKELEAGRILVMVDENEYPDIDLKSKLEQETQVKKIVVQYSL